MKQWPSEAFLNFFKVIELISDTFRSELKNKLLARISDLTPEEISALSTTKRGIINACDILDVDYDLSDVKTLVDVRNSFDVAHPSREPKFDNKFLYPCREIARELLIRYLERTQKN